MILEMKMCKLYSCNLVKIKSYVVPSYSIYQAEVTPMKRLRVVSCSPSIHKLSIFLWCNSLQTFLTALLEYLNAW